MGSSLVMISTCPLFMITGQQFRRFANTSVGVVVVVAVVLALVLALSVLLLVLWWWWLLMVVLVVVLVVLPVVVLPQLCSLLVWLSSVLSLVVM